MRCSLCGHESPAGSSFCLNCGSSLAAGPQAFAQTPAQPQGLPAIAVCGVCRGENPPGMKFCRSCGSALGGAPTSTPAFGAPSPAYGAPSPPAYGAPPSYAAPPAYAPTPSSPMAGIASGPIGTPAAPVGNYGAPDAYGARAQGSMMACPRCGTQTPLGFAFCQQCGFHVQAEAPRTRGPSSAPPITGAPIAPGPLSGLADGPIDPHAGTLASDEIRAGSVAIPARPSSAAVGGAVSGAAPWGTAVLVNRDGSDGQRFALAGEYVVIGRAGADIAFEDDRFLARQHARLERGADGVKIHPIDALNGVFRKADAPVELVDGTTILVGREVLRFERVAPEEVKIAPLVRHGVALFGSPPREPWGRFLQLIPSGGYRDVRHLAADEIVLGREEGDLVFRDDAFMSRRHAAVTWDGKRALLTDLGSSNGTFVRIIAPTPLKHGDHARMGDQLLRLELGR